MKVIDLMTVLAVISRAGTVEHLQSVCSDVTRFLTDRLRNVYPQIAHESLNTTHRHWTSRIDPVNVGKRWLHRRPEMTGRYAPGIRGTSLRELGQFSRGAGFDSD